MKEVIATVIGVGLGLSPIYLTILFVSITGRFWRGVVFTIFWFPVSYILASIFQTYVARYWNIGWQDADTIGFIPSLLVGFPAGLIFASVGKIFYRLGQRKTNPNKTLDRTSQAQSGQG